MFVGGGKTKAQLSGEGRAPFSGAASPMRWRTDARVSPSTYSIEQVVPVFRLADVEHAADIWMGNRSAPVALPS